MLVVAFYNLQPCGELFYNQLSPKFVVAMLVNTII